MNNNHISHGNGNSLEFILLFFIVIILIIYILAAVFSNRRHKQWPFYRIAFWISGVFCVATAVIGPIANRAHIDFTAHMLGHLLLGMLAPILLVLAAPMTLVLRTFNVRTARRLSSLLKSWPVRILRDPIVATLLNLGGLWILYTTNLYSLMHQNMLLHFFIHLHVFLGGYLFTMSMVYIDPTPHKSSFLYRAIVLVIALASHDVLSKYIYINPPTNVPTAQAETGAMIMYYGGDAIDIIIIFILCLQWFRAVRPRTKIHESVSF